MKSETQTISQKQLTLNQHFKYQSTQKNNKIFYSQFSPLTEKEDAQLADLLLKYPKINATSKFDVGKVNSTLHLSLKPGAVFKKQRASKVPIHLQDKVNRLLDILEQYEIIIPSK